MAKILVTIAVIVSLQETLALKCWICSSNIEFCRDPFDPSTANQAEKYFGYVECTKPPGLVNSFDEHRAVCQKAIRDVNGNRTIFRSCYWENLNAPKDECINNNTPSYIKTEFCETCDTDGCNGKNKIVGGPMALLVAISVAVAKILLF